MKFSVVALTGGIGSGKSAVASYLRERGVAVYDSDSATKRLYDEDGTIVGKMEAALGCGLRNQSGGLDRKKLAGIIFSSPSALHEVESIVHPAVLEDFIRWKNSQDGEWRDYLGQPPFVVMESAIVTEKPFFDGSYDAAVLVQAPLCIRVRRVCRRDGAREEEVMRRIASQTFDLSRINAVIENDSDLETLYRRTDEAFKLLSLQD